MKIWDMSNELIGECLSALRHQCKMSVLEVAYETELSIPTIHAYESGKGKSVPLSYVVYWMKKTGMPFHDVFNCDEDGSKRGKRLSR